MTKTDLKKQLKPLYGARKDRPELVDVPPLQYLMIDGTGDPNVVPFFEQAVGALYGAAYGLKFLSKEDGRDYTVMGLEGLWWTEVPAEFSLEDRDSWLWTLMILQPEWISRSMLENVIDTAVRKKKLEEHTARAIRLETLTEGRSAQILHVGPYSEEPPTVERLHLFVSENGLRLRGKHHEIYLSDPRRAAPEKLRTILRHPVE